jgi:hypothetical protein
VPASTRLKSELNDFPFTLIEPATVLEEAAEVGQALERALPHASEPIEAFMQSLPAHWLALVAVVFLLGAQHGFDPDHLAAIDGLARFNAAARPRLARWSGLLFSLGHGPGGDERGGRRGDGGHRMARARVA